MTDPEPRKPADWFADVLEFHRAFAPDMIGTTPAWPSIEAQALRTRLIREELAEYLDAVATRNLPDLADALGDLIYVAIGSAISHGIDLRPVWDAIHRSNLLKAGGGRRSDGKVLKSPDWIPPDIAGVLAKQGPIS